MLELSGTKTNQEIIRIRPRSATFNKSTANYTLEAEHLHSCLLSCLPATTYLRLAQIFRKVKIKE